MNYSRMKETAPPQLYWITEYLAVGPRHAADGPSMGQLGKLGFHQVIDLNEDPEEQQEARKVGLEYHGLKVRDEDSVEDWLAVLFRASEIIEAGRLEKNPVFLHCTLAVGRSPTVAMAYLVFTGHSVDEAIELVKQRRQDTWNLGNPVVKYQAILSAFSRQLAAQRAGP